MEIFTLWLWPLLALILLPGLLVYFGLHVVERGIIFVDLALAQIAALGVCVAVALGAHPGHDALPWVLSLTFTLLGAALFAWTRFRHSRVPQESIIGIIYVVSAAAATLVLSHTAEGDEALKNLLVGNVLLVTRAEVLRTFALFVAIAGLHVALRRRFMMLTFDEDEARRRGISIRTWDFLFYATFGLTVTSFVQITGVYLVFSYLIVPAVCGALLSAHVRTRLAIGWAVALIAGVTGLALSVKLEAADLPTGPTIVCCFGGALLACAVLMRLKKKSDPYLSSDGTTGRERMP
jgi:zinc/manganese transport system permease protein